MSTWPETSDQGPPPLGGVLGRLGAAAKQSWLRESLEGWEELFSAVVVEWRAVMKKQTKERLHGTGVLKTGNQYLLRPVCATPVQLPSYLSDTAIPNHPPTPSFLCIRQHVGSQFPDQVSNLSPPAVEVWSLSHWASREVPQNHHHLLSTAQENEVQRGETTHPSHTDPSGANSKACRSGAQPWSWPGSMTHSLPFHLFGKRYTHVQFTVKQTRSYGKHLPYLARS